MSRKKRKRKVRFVEGDSRYNSIKINKFINKIMINGKKATAEKIVYSALEVLSKETGETVVESFDKVLKNVMPRMEVKSRRVGGSTYQVPVEVDSTRGVSLAMRWIINNSRTQTGKQMIDCLSSEFLDAYNNTGSAVKKKIDTHKMAESNKAFAHFRW